MKSPLGARAVEGLAGAGLGALGLGAVGGLTHQTKTPTEWRDDNDRVHARALTTAEKVDRRDRIMKAVLVGAALGSGASLGAGAVRRSVLSSNEGSELQGVMSERLGGLRKIVKDLGTEADRARLPGTGERARRIRQAERGTNLLSEQEKKIKDLLGSATESRRGEPWGGLKLTGGGKTPVPHEELTHRGRVERYYRDLQKKHDLPPMHSVTDPDMLGERFFKALLEKTSSVKAFLQELDSISNMPRD